MATEAHSAGEIYLSIPAPEWIPGWETSAGACRPCAGRPPGSCPRPAAPGQPPPAPSAAPPPLSVCRPTPQTGHAPVPSHFILTRRLKRCHLKCSCRRSERRLMSNAVKSRAVVGAQIYGFGLLPSEVFQETVKKEGMLKSMEPGGTRMLHQEIYSIWLFLGRHGLTRWIWYVPEAMSCPGTLGSSIASRNALNLTLHSGFLRITPPCIWCQGDRPSAGDTKLKQWGSSLHAGHACAGPFPALC